MVAVLMQQHELSLQEAVDYVGQLCKQSVEFFESTRTQLPSWGSETDRDVQAYVLGLQDWMVGALHWSFDTTRYDDARAVDYDTNGEYVRTWVPELRDVGRASNSSSADRAQQAAAGTSDLFSLLGKAIQQTTYPDSQSRDAQAADLSASGTLIPSDLKGADRTDFVNTQRERLRT